MLSITRLFARSPFGPTQEHIDKTVECANHLRPLFEALFDADMERVRQEAEAVESLEQEADAIKNEIRSHLPKSIYLPVGRRDLLEIIHHQDSIADMTQEVASRLTLRPLEPHPELRGPVLQLVDDVLHTCNLVRDVAHDLDELVEASFGGPHAARVLEKIENIDQREKKSDAVARTAAEVLFRIESELGPVDVIFWDELIRKVGEVANFAERAANRLRLLLARAD